MRIIILLILAILAIIMGIALLGVALSLAWYLLVGLIIGGLARVIIPNTEGLGLIVTVLAGITGAFVGGVLASQADVGGIAEFALSILSAGIVVAIVVGMRGSDSTE